MKSGLQFFEIVDSDDVQHISSGVCFEIQTHSQLKPIEARTLSGFLRICREE